MEMKQTKEGKNLLIALEGRLDTLTAPELEKELNSALEGIEKLTLDFADLEYISSAGLRVLLSAQKTMNNQGRMVIRNANETVREVFEVTGFDEILTVEYDPFTLRQKSAARSFFRFGLPFFILRTVLY